MPLHPEYESLLKQMADIGGPSLSEMPVEQGREMYRMMQPEIHRWWSEAFMIKKSQVLLVIFQSEFTRQKAKAPFPSY